MQLIVNEGSKKKGKEQIATAGPKHPDTTWLQENSSTNLFLPAVQHGEKTATFGD